MRRISEVMLNRYSKAQPSFFDPNVSNVSHISDTQLD